MIRIDPGVVSLLAELRGHERRAAEELGQWKTGVKEPKLLDTSPTAITLAMICSTREQVVRDHGLVARLGQNRSAPVHYSGNNKSGSPASAHASARRCFLAAGKGSHPRFSASLRVAPKQ